MKCKVLRVSRSSMDPSSPNAEPINSLDLTHHQLSFYQPPPLASPTKLKVKWIYHASGIGDSRRGGLLELFVSRLFSLLALGPPSHDSLLGHLC